MARREFSVESPAPRGVELVSFRIGRFRLGRSTRSEFYDRRILGERRRETGADNGTFFPTRGDEAGCSRSSIVVNNGVLFEKYIGQYRNTVSPRLFLYA